MMNKDGRKATRKHKAALNAVVYYLLSSAVALRNEMVTVKELNRGDIVKAAHILLIEKNDVLRGKVAAALEREGYSVVATGDVLDGLRKLNETSPDVIIMANGLPMAEGKESYRLVRETSYVPIVVLGSGDKTVESLEGGADAYMTIPLAIEELVARVHSMLRRKRPQTIMEASERDQ